MLEPEFDLGWRRTWLETQKTRALAPLPAWLPQAARHYLEHTEAGLPIRVLARSADLHASTVLRQIRRFETRRDDPLVDDALRTLSDWIEPHPVGFEKDKQVMSQAASYCQTDHDGAAEQRLLQESMRVLRRLAEMGAVLAVARDMEKGVVVREGADGAPQRLAVVEREVAQTMALRDWIMCDDLTARISRYHITGAGRTALKDHMAAEENRAQGFCEDQSAFHPAGADIGASRLRHGLFDSPDEWAARRKDRDGQPFFGPRPCGCG